MIAQFIVIIIIILLILAIVFKRLRKIIVTTLVIVLVLLAIIAIVAKLIDNPKESIEGIKMIFFGTIALLVGVGLVKIS